MADGTITLTEAWEIAQQLRAELDIPDRATNVSVRAEWDAIDLALLERGIENIRPNEFGVYPPGIRHVWWIGQLEDGFITGKGDVLQAGAAVALSLHSPVPLVWLVPDPDGVIHRRYFPKPSTPRTNYHFQVTSGPTLNPVPLGDVAAAGGDLLDLLGTEWAETA